MVSSGPRVANESFAQWESMLSASYVPLAVDADRQGGFHGWIDRASMPDFDLSTLGSSGQFVRRTPRCIGRSDDEFLLVSILTEGIGSLHQDGRVAEVTPGDMVFYDTSRPYQWDLTAADWAQVVIRLPMTVVEEQFGTDRAHLPTAVRVAADSAGGVVAGFFRDLARIQGEAPGQAAVLAGNAVGLLSSAVRLAVGDLPTGQPAQALTREQVLSFMRSRCADPALTVDEIARSCLVSRRTLYRLFDDVGESLSAVLRRMRVDGARALLTRDPARPASSVALSAGFASERHFFRAFRLEMGMTPGEYRVLAAAAPGGGRLRGVTA